MPMSRRAQELAAEIKQHDWSDAPYRADRAGHDRTIDTNRGPEVLDPRQTDTVRLNVMWVTAQTLGYEDPNFDVLEYAKACGVTGWPDGYITAGVRTHGGWHRPGTYEPDAT